MVSSATIQYSTSSRPLYRPAPFHERLVAFVGNPEFPEVASRFALCAGLVMAPIRYPQVIPAQRHVECRQGVTAPLRGEPDPMLARALRLPSIATTASAATALNNAFIAT